MKKTLTLVFIIVLSLVFSVLLCALSLADPEDDGNDGLEVSRTDIYLDWNVGNDDFFVVTGTDNFTTNIEYDGTESADGFDFQWLQIIMSSDGQTVTARSARANYSDKERVATIIVDAPPSRKLVKVHQAACGEAAPEMTVSRDSETLQDGQNLGTLLKKDGSIVLDYETSNVRRISAQLKKIGVNGVIAESNSLTGASFSLADLTTGSYVIEIYASNSGTPNDYYKQSPFSGACMKLYFNYGKRPIIDSSKYENFPNYTSSVYYDNLKNLILSGNRADDLLAIANSQLGYREEDGRSIYAMYHGNYKTGTEGSWCAFFVSWCAKHAGLVGADKLFAGGGAASPYSLLKDNTFEIWYFYLDNGNYLYSDKTHLGWKTKDEWVHNATGEYDPNVGESEGDRSICVPQKGDLIFFKPSDSTDRWGHVGIVYDFADNFVYYIDGNGNQATLLEGVGGHVGVGKWKIEYDDQSSICAIARPNYSMQFENEEISLVVSYDYKTNTPTHSPQIFVNYGDEFTLTSPPEEVMEGRTFLGWATEPEATEAEYLPGDKYTVTDEICFYAVWSELTLPDVNTADINGDGKTDSKDAVLLAQYLANWNVTVDEDEADTTGDGEINSMDSVLLAQYIAGWQVELS